MQQRLSTVIAKPTKDCNADCEYCSSPPDLTGHWTLKNSRKLLIYYFLRCTSKLFGYGTVESR